MNRMILDVVPRTLKGSIAVTLFTLFALAWAQTPAAGPHVLTSYDIVELASRPGQLVVGTGVLSVIEFENPIEQVASGWPELLMIEVQGHIILLRGNLGVGRTDLVVRTGGRTVLFTVRIEEQLAAPRRYVVAERRTPAPRVSTAISPAAPVQVELPREAPRRSDLLTPAADTPIWLSFRADATYTPTGVLAISYALVNQSQHQLGADASRLRLYHLDPIAGPVRLPHTLSRVSVEGLVNRVAAGGTEFGTIIVTDPPVGGRIVLEWPLVQLGPAVTYTLNRTFSDFVREIGR